jgi:octaprenyl-diphosphate synthase
MAFQITDDLLDILGNTDKEGKTLGTDLLNEKITLPVINWLRQGGDQFIKQKMDQLKRNTDPYALYEAIKHSGAIEYTRQRAEAFGSEALRNLGVLPDSPAKHALESLVSYVLNRI